MKRLRTWSGQEAITFLMNERPAIDLDLMREFYFHNPPYYLSQASYLELFDRWLVLTKRTPINELMNGLGDLLLGCGYALKNEKPNLRLQYNQEGEDL